MTAIDQTGDTNIKLVPDVHKAIVNGLKGSESIREQLNRLNGEYEEHGGCRFTWNGGKGLIEIEKLPEGGDYYD